MQPPAGEIKIAGDLKVDPRETIYAGDTAVDMKTDVCAGMFPVGVSWGYQPEDVLRKNGAQAVVAAPEQILALL
jgi:phosphoglycolate phosphatase